MDKAIDFLEQRHREKQAQARRIFLLDALITIRMGGLIEHGGLAFY